MKFSPRWFILTKERSPALIDSMPDVRENRQAEVRIGYDGRVYKRYTGLRARDRFENERRVLRYLEAKGCPFVPRILEENAENLSLVTSNAGSVVEKIGQAKVAQLFAELEQYGVRHEDPFARNVTYNPHQGRFNLIDFEFATILETGEGLKLEDVKPEGKALNLDEIHD